MRVIVLRQRLASLEIECHRLIGQRRLALEDEADQGIGGGGLAGLEESFRRFEREVIAERLRILRQESGGGREERGGGAPIAALGRERGAPEAGIGLALHGLLAEC